MYNVRFTMYDVGCAATAPPLHHFKTLKPLHHFTTPIPENSPNLQMTCHQAQPYPPPQPISMGFQTRGGGFNHRTWQRLPIKLSQTTRGIHSEPKLSPYVRNEFLT